MKKFGKYTLLVISIVVMLLSFTACSGYKFEPVTGGDSKATVESNGGQVVKQGNHIYFVNGKTDENAANEFGKVVKGAIYRATLNEDGTLVKDKEGNADIKAIVPKNVFTKKDSGFYIFGEYIYYLTPSNEKDNKGVLLNNTADVMRVKIDGTHTEKLGYVDSLEYDYRFIDGYFIYASTNTITICEAKKGLPVKKTIENVTSFVLPKNTDNNELAQYIFYTRNLTEEENEKGAYSSNMLCSIKFDGSNEITLVDKTTKFDGLDKNEKNTITLNKKYLLSNDSITIYYTRKADQNLSEKFYSYTFTKDSLAKAENKVYFDTAKETLIYTNTVGEVIPYAKDIVFEVKDKAICYYKGGNINYVTIVNPETGSGEFSGSIIDFKKEDNKVMMYYTTSSGLYKKVIEENGQIISGDKIQIYNGSIGVSNFGNEFVGNYFYFTDTKMYNYVVRIDYTKLAEANKEPEKIYVLNEADQKEYDEAHKEDK